MAKLSDEIGISANSTDGTQLRDKIARWRRYVGWIVLPIAVLGLGGVVFNTVLRGSLLFEGLTVLSIVAAIFFGLVWVGLHILDTAVNK